MQFEEFMQILPVLALRYRFLSLILSLLEFFFCRPVSTTARITYIDNTTTNEALKDFLDSKHLPLAPGQHISFTSSEDECNLKTATVTFADKATCKRATHLPFTDMKLNNKYIFIEDEFKGLTVLSEGNEVE